MHNPTEDDDSPDQTQAFCTKGGLLHELLGWTVCTEQEGMAGRQKHGEGKKKPKTVIV